MESDYGMELGGEYNLPLSELNVTEDNIFNYLSEFDNCYYFDSGRSALKHISKHFNHDRKVMLPEFICQSISNCFDKSMIRYYKIMQDFKIDVDDLISKAGDDAVVIFLMHYFGTLQPEDVLIKLRAFADQNGSIIIEDTTHSIFTQKKTIGDYMICSIRKWTPIPGGGVLYYSQNKFGLKSPNYRKSNDNFRSYGMILKDLFLNDRLDCNTTYRKIFSESEEALDKETEIFEISDFARFIVSCISIENVRKTRKRNYELLKAELNKEGIRPAINLHASDTPFAFPLRVHNRDMLRSYLSGQRIYCAVHWPFDNHESEYRLFAKRNSEELISLPVDQRYDERHIRYLIGALQKYGGDLLF